MDTIYQNDLTLAQGGSFIEARFLLRREFRPSAMENNLDLPVLARSCPPSMLIAFLKAVAEIL
jgi:hypothetical protein